MILTLLLACFDDLGGTIGCDFRAQTSSPEDRCQERAGIQSNGFDSMCDGLGGDVVDGGCSRDGSIGECDEGSGVVDIYYAPMSVEDAEADCADDGGSFTAA